MTQQLFRIGQTEWWIVADTLSILEVNDECVSTCKE